ncbi:MAG: DNA repair exonuclease [Acetobacteraceae bacterium]|nr:DNA repair exonuclease [Acetobacteraceae bacterium]
MAITFIHAADIHLDSPMAGMMRRDPALAELTARSTRDAFSNLVDAAIAQDVDFLLIAGDLYDTEHKDYETGLFFAREMRRLGRPCVMIHGNHDSASQITKSLQPPPNVTILPSDAAGLVTLERSGVVIHGQSFAARAEAEDLAASYRNRVDGAFNIGLLHSSMENPGNHARYAPCRLETLVNKGYDYWALGHIHTRATLHEWPHVHFPGNTQGRHVREEGWRGATLVSVDEGRVRSLTPIATDVIRWTVIRCDVSASTSLNEVAAQVRFELAAARLSAEGRPLIVRVVLTGATALHAALLSSPAAIYARCTAAALDVADDVHIERVKLQTAPASTDRTDLAALEEAVRSALTDTGVAESLLKDFARLRGAVPDKAEVQVPQNRDELADLLDDAWSVIRHALTGAAFDADEAS